MKVKCLLAAAAFALGVGTCGATELFRVRDANIMSYNAPFGSVYGAFDGIVGTGQDTAEWINIDLLEPMHIVSMRFHGRGTPGVNERMRNANFYVSNDAQNWTLLYTVPWDYLCDGNYANVPWPDAATAAASWRYVRWDNVSCGSIEEFEIYVDSDSFQMGATTLDDYSHETFAVSSSVEQYGAFAQLSAEVYCAVGTSDFGTDLVDWISGGSVTNCGTIANDAVTQFTVASLGAGVATYVRLFAVCGGETRCSQPMSFTPADPSRERMFPLADANLVTCTPGNEWSVGRAYNGIYDREDSAPSATFDLLAQFHITRIMFHSRPGLAGRMHGATFSVSEDGVNWYTVYTVPGSYNYEENMSAVEWYPTASETYRYVKWDGIQFGSMDEFQVYVDSDAVFMDTPLVMDYSADTMDVSVTAQLFGSLISNGATVIYAIAASDLGDDFDDWAEGGVTGVLGVAASGVPLAGRIPTLGSGVTLSMRAFAANADGILAGSAPKTVTPSDQTMFQVAPGNVIDADSAQANYMGAFDGNLDENYDTATRATIDLGALYPIARLRFFDRTGLAQRMCGASFAVSKDNSTWTTVYTVPGDFNETEPVGTFVTWPSGDGVCTGDNLFRYVRWQNVQFGSISEFQIFVGESSVLVMEEFRIESYSSTNIDVVASSSTDGPFSDPAISFSCAYAATDLGEDLADWIDSGTVVSVGTSQSGVAAAFSIPFSGDGSPVTLRMFAEADGIQAVSGPRTVTPRNLVEVRPLVETSASSLESFNYYAGPGEVWNAFDHDASTFTGSGIEAAGVDMGRPVRIDVARVVRHPGYLGDSSSLRVQGSLDGMTWDTYAGLGGAVGSETEILEFAAPAIARYVRFINKSGNVLVAPYVRELQFFVAEDGQACQVFPAEGEIARAPGGITLSGEIAAAGGFAGNVGVTAFAAASDLGHDPAAWAASGAAVATDLGTKSASSAFTATVPPVSASGINVVRLRYASAAGTFMGAPHFFVADAEQLIEFTVEQVAAMSAQANPWAYSANDTATIRAQPWRHTFFGDGSLACSSDVPTPAAASLPMRYRITRVELMPRMQSYVIQRAAGVAVYVAPERTAEDWTQGSAWTQVAYNGEVPSGDAWVQLVASPRIKGYHVMANGGSYGNYFLRFWGVPCIEGTLLMIK